MPPAAPSVMKPPAAIGVTVRSAASRGPADMPGGGGGGASPLGVVVSEGARRSTLTAMADLVAKADAQLAVFRRTLEESARVEQLSRTRSAHLSESLDAGVKLVEALDAKLVRARGTEQTLEQAKNALDGLTTLVTQIRAGRSELDGLIARHARQRKADLEQALADQQAQIESAMKEQRAALDARLEDARAEAGQAAEDVAALVRSAKEEAQAVVAGLEEALKSDAGRLSTLLAQRADNVRARLEESLERGQQRLDEIRRQAEELSTAGLERAQAICDRAEALLGVPETEDAERTQEAGGLLGAISRGEGLISRVDETVLRLAVLADNGDQIREGVEKAIAEGEALSAEHRRQSQTLQAAITEGAKAAREVQASLDASAQQTGEALARADHAAATVRDLSALVESLQAMAEQQAQRAKAAEHALDKAIARAGEATQSINRCLEHVTTQAGDLVTLARDIARLIERGEALKNGPVAQGEEQRGADDEPKGKGRKGTRKAA